MKLRKKIISLLLVTCIISISSNAFAYLTIGSPIPWKYATMYKSSSLESIIVSSLPNAMATWNNAGSKFRFYDGGSGTGAMTTLDTKCEIGEVDFTKDSRIPPDYRSSNVLAITMYNTDYPYHPDIYFNRLVKWSNSIWLPGSYNPQGLATHELGHVLKLKDVKNYQGDFFMPTMFHAFTYNPLGSSLDARTLERDDIQGVKALYP